MMQCEHSPSETAPYWDDDHRNPKWCPCETCRQALDRQTPTELRPLPALLQRSTDWINQTAEERAEHCADFLFTHGLITGHDHNRIRGKAKAAANIQREERAKDCNYEADFLLGLADRMCLVPATHFDGGDIDEMRSIARRLVGARQIGEQS